MQQNSSTSGSVIRVLVIASSVVMQAGLEALLVTSPEIDIVGSVTRPNALTQQTLIQQMERSQPDVVLWEWDDAENGTLPVLLTNMAHEGLGSEGLNRVVTPPIVVVVDDWQQPAIAAILNAGVRGILPSDATATEIVGAIAAAANGLTVIHPDLSQALLSSLPPPRAVSTAPSEALTNREVEVLSMLAEGLGNKAIARRLNISEHTVKFHIGSIFSKLNASSRTEAVILGARQGLILL
jgi:two-component system, NarL family, response regulator YdfI